MPIDLIVIVGVLATSLAGFLWALGRRWFGRFRRGFLVVRVLACTRIGLAVSLVLGISGYGCGKTIYRAPQF